MIEFLINIIRDFLLPYGAWGVFLAAIVEEVIAPIPSAMVLLASGFFLISGHNFELSVFKDILFTVAIPGGGGIVLGSLAVYGIAYFFGKPVLQKWHKYLGLSWSEIEKLEQKFENGYIDEIALFAARALPVIPSVVISAFCGLVRMPLKEYVIFSFLGSVVRAFALGFIGWQTGAVYEKIALYINAVENFVLATLVLAIIVFLGYKFMHNKQQPF